MAIQHVVTRLRVLVPVPHLLLGAMPFFLEGFGIHCICDTKKKGFTDSIFYSKYLLSLVLSHRQNQMFLFVSH